MSKWNYQSCAHAQLRHPCRLLCTHRQPTGASVMAGQLAHACHVRAASSCLCHGRAFIWCLCHGPCCIWPRLCGLPRIVKDMLGWGRIGQVSVAQTLQLSQRRQIISRRADHDKILRKKRQYAAVGELTLPSSSCSAAAASRTFLGFLFVEVCMRFLLRNLGRASVGSQDQRLKASDLEKQRKYLRLGLL